jgi:hypothetical protein
MEVKNNMGSKLLITIPLDEYNDLIEASIWLECLEGAGVDSWEGVSFAQELMEERNEQNN